MPVTQRWLPCGLLIWAMVISTVSMAQTLSSPVKPFLLDNITPRLLSNGRTVLDLSFKGNMPDINHLIMADPPRVVVDLGYTLNETGQNIVKVSKSNIQRVKIIRDDERLRLILDLSRAAQFSAEKLDNGYRVHIKDDVRQAALSLKPKGLSNTNLPGQAQFTQAIIDELDFRRTTNGGGRVIVKLTANTIVDFSEQSGEFIADFINAKISQTDERRLDTLDFATPVSTIDLFQDNNNVRMVITASGQYGHTVSQSENRFVVDIFPLTQQELIKLAKAESGYSGEVLSFNFQRIPVRAALQVIADFTGTNIITSDSVDGDLTLHLNDVPWDQALDLILQTKNLGMRQKGNVIRVAPSAELIEQERAEFAAKKDVIDLEPLVIELIRVNYAKAEDIGQLLKSVKAVDTGLQQTPFGSVSISEIITEENTLLSSRGSVAVDSRTNILLVQDTPSHIRDIRKLVEQLDIPVRQIQIETRIVEATEDFSRSLGARIGFTRITDGANFPGSSSGLGTAYGSGSIEAASSVRDDNDILYPESLSINLPADNLGGESAASYAFQIAKLGTGYAQLLDLEISALQAEGKGKVIANPKITTTNKNEAHIEQGQERIFTSTSLVGGGTITKKAVLGLTVTPQITPDDQIIMDVFISNDSFAGTNTLNTKQINTQILLGNGETVVIGGIYQQDEGEIVTKTPLLGDIPIIGNLFKKRTRRNNRTELLVFLTPRIIKSSF